MIEINYSPTHFTVSIVELSLKCSEEHILDHCLTETISRLFILSETTEQKGSNSATMGNLLLQATFLR